jgi:phospholipid/cholesterol/gamma-HCH transport system permease protein
LYTSPALNITPAAYIMQTLSLLTPGDVWQGVAKAFVFAVLICLIGISTAFPLPGGAGA